MRHVRLTDEREKPVEPPKPDGVLLKNLSDSMKEQIINRAGRRRDWSVESAEARLSARRQRNQPRTLREISTMPYLFPVDLTVVIDHFERASVTGSGVGRRISEERVTFNIYGQTFVWHALRQRYERV